MGGGYCKTAKSLKAVLFSALFLSFLLLNTTFISCAGGASGPKGSEAEGTALAIKLPDTAKTIYNKEDIVSFTVTVSSGSFTSTKSANKGETMLFSNLPVGNYSVKAYGKTSRGAVAAKCETSVTIVAGETTTTTLHLSRLEHWTVTFMNADGSELSTQDISDGYTVAKPADPAPSAGMAFSFWTADATATETSTPFSFNTPITDNITLKPVFGTQTYTITYVSAAKAVASETYTVVSGRTLYVPTEAEQTAVKLTFAGWYEDSDFTSAQVTEIPANSGETGNRTFYAKWTAKVTFDSRNGGSPIESDPRIYNVDTAAAVKPANPTKTGATFVGWYTGTVSGSGASETVTYSSTAYDFTSKVTSDITLYAKWDSREITYVSPIELGTDYTTTTGAYKYYPATGWTSTEMPAPTHTGLTFAGWYEDEAFTEAKKVTSIASDTSGEKTLYAKWTATVSFDTGSGGSAVTAQTVTYGDTASAPSTNPTWTGCTFLDWYTSSDSGVTLSSTAYDFDTEITENLTLYAKWRKPVTLKTGSEINSLLKTSLGATEAPNKTFRASTTPPGTGTITCTMSDSSSAVEVKIWISGSVIKYYAEGYTDCDEKIPLNADSSQMFYGCKNLTSIDVSGFDTSNVNSMKLMFCTREYSSDTSVLSGITGLSGFDTSHVTDMNYMFGSNPALTSLDVSNFDTRNVEDMNYMFTGCSSLISLDLSSFNTNNVTEMNAMFNGCSGLTTIYASSSFVTTNVYTDLSVFADCTSLVGGAGTVYDFSAVGLGKTYARIDGGPSSPGYFTAK